MVATQLRRLRALLVRLVCKLWEVMLRTRTRLLRWTNNDPTQILLDHLTPEQDRLAAALAKTKGERQDEGKTRLLVLIPFRDRWALTAKCLRSLVSQKMPNASVRVVLIDNGSTEAATAAGIRSTLATSGAGLEFVTLRVDEAFNFSRLNNRAAEAHKDFGADDILFLNNDVEFSNASDVTTLLNFAHHGPNVGAVGCTLVYPNGRVQHLFVAPGVKIIAAHPLKNRQLSDDARWFKEPRPVGAVTGAVMLVPAAAFHAAGGFDEALGSVGQDIDLCLQLRSRGHSVWVVPYVRAIHHESATRHQAFDKDETRHMYAKWGRSLTHDGCYSERFSRWSEAPALTLGEGAYPWDMVLP